MSLCPRSSEILKKHRNQVEELRLKCHPYRMEGVKTFFHQGPVVDLENSYLHYIKGDEKTSLDSTFLSLASGGQDKEYSIKHYKLYGLHRYGGYPLFFRPDLCEVFWLMLENVSKEDLEKCVAFYVTTEPYPTGHIGHCYDNKNDRHRAVTYCDLIFQTKASG